MMNELYIMFTSGSPAPTSPQHEVHPYPTVLEHESYTNSQCSGTVGYGCTSCWGDIGAGDPEVDIIYISFIVSVQHMGY